MKFDYSDFFDSLTQTGLLITDEQRQIITEKITQVLSYEPKIGIFGKTGVGKSSLCNALFGQDIAAISDIEACTRNPQEILLKIGQGNSKGIKLIDVPGVGESQERDKEYAQLYAKLLPELDVVLWLLKGDDRAFTSDEVFYKNVVKPHLDQGKVFFIVVNQVDKIEPFREWDEKNHRPGPNQLQNIEAKLSVVSRFFSTPVSKIIAVSADEKYNLVRLIDEIVFALPKDKKVTFASNVKKENVSEPTKTKAEKGFWDTAWDIVTEVVPAVIESIPIVGSFYKGVKSIFKWFF